MCAKVGRSRAFTDEDYLKAVEKTRSMDDKKIGLLLKVNRSSVYRFRKDKQNLDIITKGMEIIKKYSEKEHVVNINDRIMFDAIPLINDYHIKLNRRGVSEGVKNRYLRGIFNICNHFKVHPNNLTLEMCIQLNSEMKDLYYKDIKAPRGLSYTSLREAIRSFFTLMHNVSGEYLSNEGITKEETKGTGKYAKQRVSQEVRHTLEETIKPLVRDYNEYLEAIYTDKFMYYTGTRITASLEFSFKTNEYDLTKDTWIFEVVDKGEHRKGRMKWEKVLSDFALDDFKKYCNERFNIPIRNLESELPYTTDLIFPSLNVNRIVDINKVGLINAGLQYREFPPNHIWRHTFAQDFLDATNHNYELCAEVGGWKSTYILKKHYGSMDKKTKLRGIRKAMGIEIKEEVRRILKW